MLHLRKKTLACLLLMFLALGAIASPVLAEEPYYGSAERTAMRMFGDLLLVRPLGLLSTAFGSVVFVAGLPFSAIGGNVNESAEKLVVEPARFTFVRPLGELPESRYAQ